MEIRFSVNSPKIGKREINRGEDAPAVNKDGIMIICDGTGATGQAEHTVSGETYTSAYLGSRETSRIAEEFLTENYERLLDGFCSSDNLQKTVFELGKAIKSGLNQYAKNYNLTLTVHGKSFKLLPTTFTAVVYKSGEMSTNVIVISAGDSKALWWDTEGLHQLSVEDSVGADISVGDCSVSNCVSADGDFCLSFTCHTLKSNGILLATSDGFTDPLKPFEQERYLIEWIGNFENLCEQNSNRLSEEISCKLDDIGFTGRDDCSIAGVILGYSSDEELKNDFRKRYKNYLVESYLLPYKELNSRYKAAEAELIEAKATLLDCEKQIVAVINSGILNYLKKLDNISNLHKDPLFGLFVNSDAVSMEIRRENNSIENAAKEKRLLSAKNDEEFKKDYLDFLKMLCREYGEVRFPEEIITALKEYDEKREILTECTKSINSELLALDKAACGDGDIYSLQALSEISQIAKKLTENARLGIENYETYKNCRDLVLKYFSYQNAEIEQFLNEDLQNRFAILKKTSFLPLPTSKKQLELKAFSKHLLELYDSVTKLNEQTTPQRIQNEKNIAFRTVVMRFSKDIAKELFLKEEHWEEVLENKMEDNIPQLKRYEEIKAQNELILKQREELLNSYNLQYEKYLNNPLQGKAFFGKEGDR